MDNPFQVAGTTQPLKSQVPRVLFVLSFLPLLLVPIGGLIGGLIGGAAAAINVVVARGRLGVRASIAVILAVTAAAVVLYVGVATAVTVATTPVATLPVGTCLNGIHPGVTVTADLGKPVDCATRHDNEIVGVVSYTLAGSYPGQAAVDAFANAPCTTAFGAYVGIDFAISTLDMVTLTPSELTWARGDRQISCVVIARDGSQLTGSVRDARR